MSTLKGTYPLFPADLQGIVILDMQRAAASAQVMFAWGTYNYWIYQSQYGGDMFPLPATAPDTLVRAHAAAGAGRDDLRRAIYIPMMSQSWVGTSPPWPPTFQSDWNMQYRAFLNDVITNVMGLPPLIGY